MATKGLDNIKLGAFVFLGFVLLVAALFYVSNSNSLFRSDKELRARFTNAAGLQEGNNVFFSGIDAGTVKSITLIDANTIEVTMLIDRRIMPHIPADSHISIGTEGLMGNKVVNISPGKSKHFIAEGDYLTVEKRADIEQMLETLSGTNDNVAAISSALRATTDRIGNSELLEIIDDKKMMTDLRVSIENIRRSTVTTVAITNTVNQLVSDTRDGKGAAGLLLSDQEFARDLNVSMTNIREATDQINIATQKFRATSATLDSLVTHGKGPLNLMLRDTALTAKLNATAENVRKGTESFNQNMEALKHNFLVRGYFKRQEKQKAKKDEKATRP